MPANSSRLNVVTREKSTFPSRCNAIRSRYKPIGVWPVGRARTSDGLARIAAAMSAASVRAAESGAGKMRIRKAVS